MNVKEKSFLVTGGNSGIGKSVVKLLLQQGAKVFALDVKTDQLEILKNHNAGKLQYLNADLTDFSNYNALFETAKGSGYLFDGMVHCAGISPLMKIEDNDIETMLLTYRINVLSFIELLKYFHKSDYTNDGASVATMTSIATSVASYRQTVYSSSKAALEQVVRCAAKEFMDRKIRINAVSAGAVETEMLVKLEKESEGLREKFLKYYPLGLIAPEEIANTLIYLLSDESKHMDGTILRLDSGFFVNK